MDGFTIALVNALQYCNCLFILSSGDQKFRTLRKVEENYSSHDSRQQGNDHLNPPRMQSVILCNHHMYIESLQSPSHSRREDNAQSQRVSQ